MKSKRYQTPFWNLLLGDPGQGILTLGDNRKVDFSSSMFLTSNLGGAEMSSLSEPRLGFHAPVPENSAQNEKRGAQMKRVVSQRRAETSPLSLSTAWTKPWFSGLWAGQSCDRIVDIGLEMVQARVQNAAADKSFGLNVTDSAREFL